MTGWLPQVSGTHASLRGVSAVSAQVAWASGEKGTVIKTIDGGRHWLPSSVPHAEELDFRDVESFDGRTAWILDKSRLYRTNDGGAKWTLHLTNPDQNGFFDALAFFNPHSGVLLGDPVDGRFVIYTTADGINWLRRQGPEALPGEGAFAASGTCLIARPNGEAWFGTGGARVFHSTDFGVTWAASQTPLNHSGKAAGVFSLAFRDSRHGIAVGGDYTKPASGEGNVAITDDGGRTWHEPPSRPAGYRSAAQFRQGRKALATGTSGSDASFDGGLTWTPLESSGYNAMAFRGKNGWAVGPEGRIARWR